MTEDPKRNSETERGLVDERLLQLHEYEIAERVKERTIAWAKWTFGVIVAVLALFGIKTFWDIQTGIQRRVTEAVDDELQTARGRVEALLGEFENEQEQLLQEFGKQKDDALERFQNRAEEAIKDVEQRRRHFEELVDARTEELRQEQFREPQFETPVIQTRRAVRPVGSGVSVSVRSGERGVGTICCVVEDDAGDEFLLSTNYVFGQQIGAPIIQPGAQDLLEGVEAADYVVAELSAFSPVKFTEPNTTGGAIAKIKRNIERYYEIPSIGPIRGVRDWEDQPLTLGEIVRKFGRTTELTVGAIERVDVHTRIVMPSPDGQSTAIFSGTAEVKGLGSAFSQGGDGGAPVVDQQGRLVGFIYGGGHDRSIILPIVPTLRQLDVEVAGVEGSDE